MARLIVFGLLSLMLMSHSFADDDHNEAYELLQSGDILPLEKILHISRKQVQGRILEVELEHEHDLLIYELKILDKHGIVWKIEINATTGTILKKGQN